MGYIASSNKNALNLLVIPEYDVLVACIDNKYTLINPSGQELFPTVADDIYMTIEAGENHYYIAVNNSQMDAIEYLERKGIKSTNNQKENDSRSNSVNELQEDNTSKSNSTNELKDDNDSRSNSSNELQENTDTDESNNDNEQRSRQQDNSDEDNESNEQDSEEDNNE